MVQVGAVCVCVRLTFRCLPLCNVKLIVNRKNCCGCGAAAGGAVAAERRLRDMLGALPAWGKGSGFNFLTQALSSLVIIFQFLSKYKPPNVRGLDLFRGFMVAFR